MLDLQLDQSEGQGELFPHLLPVRCHSVLILSTNSDTSFGKPKMDEGESGLSTWFCSFWRAVWNSGKDRMRSGRGAETRPAGAGVAADRKHHVVQGSVRRCVSIEKLLVQVWGDKHLDVAARDPILHRVTGVVTLPAIQTVRNHQVRVQEFGCGYLPAGSVLFGNADEGGIRRDLFVNVSNDDGDLAFRDRLVRVTDFEGSEFFELKVPSFVATNEAAVEGRLELLATVCSDLDVEAISSVRSDIFDDGLEVREGQLACETDSKLTERRTWSLRGDWLELKAAIIRTDLGLDLLLRPSDLAHLSDSLLLTGSR